MASENEILGRAAELIGERGWNQGALEGPDGSLCALGAMGRAKGELFNLYAGEETQVAANAYGLAYTKLINEINPDSEADPWSRLVSVPQWNDSPERTAEDVILAMKSAAANPNDPIEPFRGASFDPNEL